MRTIACTCLALLLLACASTRPSIQGSMSTPADWANDALTVGQECQQFSGTFLNNGLGYEKNIPESFDGRLDVALGETMPSTREPETVSLEYKPESDELSVAFFGVTASSYSINAICENGWIKFSLFEEDKYLGDGTNLDHSEKLIELAMSNNGRLLLHQVSDVQFSTLLLFKQKEFNEYWYTFEGPESAH